MIVEADLESAQQHRAFVVVVRSRALRLRLTRANRETSWLMRRSRYLMKRFADPTHLHRQVPWFVLTPDSATLERALACVTRGHRGVARTA